MLDKKRNIRPDIEGEMDELQRASQDLSREEGIEISVKDMVEAFQKSKEETLIDDIWVKLENTESNEIEKGDLDAVYDIAKKYKKTNPKKLIKAFKNNTYKRPLILKLGERYILIAGNTRLSTAAAMGINPKVFIANLEIEKELDEKWSKKYKNSIDCSNPKGFSQRAHCQGKKKKEAKESMGADSAGGYEGPMSFTMKKSDIDKINNWKELKESLDASASGEFDVPLFGGTKGRKSPLSIGGPESIKKRINKIKGPKFPKWGGPESVFVQVKEKCKKFPYCNQGDINALEISEIEGLNEAINETAKKYGLSVKEIENIVLNEIKRIFI